MMAGHRCRPWQRDCLFNCEKEVEMMQQKKLKQGKRWKMEQQHLAFWTLKCQRRRQWVSEWVNTADIYFAKSFEKNLFRFTEQNECVGIFQICISSILGNRHNWPSYNSINCSYLRWQGRWCPDKVVAGVDRLESRRLRLGHLELSRATGERIRERGSYFLSFEKVLKNFSSLKKFSWNFLCRCRWLP